MGVQTSSQTIWIVPAIHESRSHHSCRRPSSARGAERGSAARSGDSWLGGLAHDDLELDGGQSTERGLASAPSAPCDPGATATTYNAHGRCSSGSPVYSVVEPRARWAPLRSPGLLWRGHRGRCYRRLGRLSVIAAWCCGHDTPPVAAPTVERRAAIGVPTVRGAGC